MFVGDAGLCDPDSRLSNVKFGTRVARVRATLNEDVCELTNGCLLSMSGLMRSIFMGRVSRDTLLGRAKDSPPTGRLPEPVPRV